MTKKLNNKGFTLVELLCTIAVVILLTSCITLGVGLATKSFDKTYRFAKAQTLSSTLNYLISDELRTACYAKSESGSLRYKSENYIGKYPGEGKKTGCVFMKVGDDKKNEGRIVVDTGDDTDGYNSGGIYTLAAPSLYGDNLLVKDFSVSISDDSNFKVHYIIVDKKKQDTPLVTNDFQVKAMEVK